MDETGDDGYPKYSSNFFVLTSIYFDHQYWKDNYKKLHDFRKQLKATYGFPVKMEFHTKDFLWNKKPYCQFSKYSKENRCLILADYVNCLCSLQLQVINTVIDKTKIVKTSFDILSAALSFNIQRLENDIVSKDLNNKYLVITDEGRVGKMRKIVRKMQVMNYIPSQFGGTRGNIPIQGIIEDPLPKDSKESLFIQSADLISYLIFLYVNPVWSNRIQAVITRNQVDYLLRLLKNNGILNLKASADSQYGIVLYPKNKTI
ncbi:DUF3800 domain-containing protein [bacterium]|nr:DUF3800 domain-containing protein [FCB group bacterium]MBL7190870.1 DUF3800 domain-containing protein [bacterium]